MLWTVIGLLMFFWVVGLLARVGGDLVHTLLGLAVLLFVVNLFTGRRVT